MDTPAGQPIVPNDNNPGQVGQQPQPGVAPAPQPDPESVGWEYAADDDPASFESSIGDVSWTGAEFVEHQKSTSWYALLAAVVLAIASADFWFTRDLISTGAIILAAALFGVYAGHKPRTQQYHLSPQGLQIGNRLFVFQSFKNFSVTEEGNLVSIIFMPLKRFAPPLTIYVAPDLEDQVLDYLSNFLPLEQHRADAVDGLLRRIRF